MDQFGRSAPGFMFANPVQAVVINPQNFGIARHPPVITIVQFNKVAKFSQDFGFHARNHQSVSDACESAGVPCISTALRSDAHFDAVRGIQGA